MEIIIFNLINNELLSEELITELNVKGSLMVRNIDTPLEVNNALQKLEQGVFLFYVDHAHELIQVRTILKKIKSKVFGNQIKAIAICKEKTPKAIKALNGHGVKDIFNSQVEGKQIAEKILNFIPAELPTSDGTHELTVKPDDSEKEEIIENILKMPQVPNINTESGQLNISMDNSDLKDMHCTLEGFTESELELEVFGTPTLKKNDPININIVFAYDKCKIELMLEGVARDIEKTSMGSVILTLSLNSNESENLENFMALFEKRQKSINDFMALARGY